MNAALGWRLAALRLAQVCVAAGLFVLLAACGSKGVKVMDDSGEPWLAKGDACVRQSEDGATRRVINRADPELCGRSLKHRPLDYVRVIPPPGKRSQ
jgi:hypothetical protein